MKLHLLRLTIRHWLTVLFLAGLLVFLPGFSQFGEASASTIPRTTQVILAKATRLINDKDYAGAAATLIDFQSHSKNKRMQAGSPYHHAEVYHVLGICYLLDNKYEQAASALELALQQDPLHISAVLNLAKVSYELGNYQKAATCFEKAYETETKDEKNPEHLYFAAVANLLAKENKKSIVQFERLLKTCPDSFRPEWRENLVHALLETDENRRALSHILVLTEEHTGDKQIQWQEILLHQYLLLDMNEEALALAEKLAAQTPTEPKWWRALVHIHLNRNHYKPALSALLIKGYLDPLSDQEQRLCADLYLQLGVPCMAAPMYEIILESEKNKQQLLPNLIVSLQQLGKLEDALGALEQFAPQPLPPNLSMIKADLLYSLGRYDEAANLYADVAEENGKEKKRALQMAGYAKILASANSSMIRR